MDRLGLFFEVLDELIIPNWQMSPTILKLLKMCHENASS
jgi:hypothetical protein